MKPTAERVRSLLVFDAHEEKHPFRWQSWFQFRAWETMAYYSKLDGDDSLVIKIDGEWFQADELAWLFMTGEWPQHEILHADGNRLNNSWDNIKEKAVSLKVA